jgi:hypothetical protein
MGKDDVLLGYRLRLFSLAGEIGVRPACRAMGVHHSTYYRWAARVERWGLEALRPRERPNPGRPSAKATTRCSRCGPSCAGRPTGNGHVERLQLTILEECWRPSFSRSLVPKLTALQRDLIDYLDYYG